MANVGLVNMRVTPTRATERQTTACAPEASTALLILIGEGNAQHQSAESFQTSFTK